MKRKAQRKSSAGKVIAGMLVGGVVGATVGWLTAPAAGEETRRRIRGSMMEARDKAKSAAKNVESTARELIAEADESRKEWPQTVGGTQATAGKRSY